MVDSREPAVDDAPQIAWLSTINSQFSTVPRIKFCGVTHLADAEAAIAAGADALGFNGWSGSKRYLDLEEAGWIATLPPFVTRVAVLVNATLHEALAVSRLPYIDAVQFHGDEDAEYCRRFAHTGGAFIKALRIPATGALEDFAGFGTRCILLDASVPGAYGGTGTVIDLPRAAEVIRGHPDLRFILSGGLTPDNVAAAIRETEPFAVDVASGIESAPGRKDAARMRAFSRAALAKS